MKCTKSAFSQSTCDGPSARTLAIGQRQEKSKKGHEGEADIGAED